MIGLFQIIPAQLKSYCNPDFRCSDAGILIKSLFFLLFCFEVTAIFHKPRSILNLLGKVIGIFCNIDQLLPNSLTQLRALLYRSSSKSGQGLVEFACHTVTTKLPYFTFREGNPHKYQCISFSWAPAIDIEESIFELS